MEPILEITDFRLAISGQFYRISVILDSPCGKVAYRVGSDTNLTDRFYRNYTVRAESNGMPKSCSCPDCYHRQSWCKHLISLERWWRANTAEGVKAQRELVALAKSMGF